MDSVEKVTIFKHLIFINVTNKVVRHIVDEIEMAKDEFDAMSDEERYSVTYSKASEMFRVTYYSEDDSRYKTEMTILKTFRDRCVVLNSTSA